MVETPMVTHPVAEESVKELAVVATTDRPSRRRIPAKHQRQTRARKQRKRKDLDHRAMTTRMMAVGGRAVRMR